MWVRGVERLKMPGFETVCRGTECRGRTIEVFAFVLAPVTETLDSPVCTAKSIFSTCSHFVAL